MYNHHHYQRQRQQYKLIYDKIMNFVNGHFKVNVCPSNDTTKSCGGFYFYYSSFSLWMKQMETNTIFIRWWSCSLAFVWQTQLHAIHIGSLLRNENSAHVSVLFLPLEVDFNEWRQFWLSSSVWICSLFWIHQSSMTPLIVGEPGFLTQKVENLI